MPGCPSGQREQTVNLPAIAYGGSNPSPGTVFVARADFGPLGRTDAGRPSSAGGAPTPRPCFLARADLRPVGRNRRRSALLRRWGPNPTVAVVECDSERRRPSTVTFRIPPLRLLSSVAEHLHGKEGVPGSNPGGGSGSRLPCGGHQQSVDSPQPRPEREAPEATYRIRPLGGVAQTVRALDS